MGTYGAAQQSLGRGTRAIEGVAACWKHAGACSLAEEPNLTAAAVTMMNSI